MIAEATLHEVDIDIPTDAPQSILEPLRAVHTSNFPELLRRVGASLPGFTRGLDFAGNLAFVGLPQVRESAVFSGIPISERLDESERTCGVCVVDLQRGEPVALLRFEDAVQEVFAVSVAPGKR
jgi:uncharacterized protein (TIGR03032 family)